MAKGEGRGSGPEGRISRLRKLVTSLVRHERLEGNLDYLDETRGYVERLVYLAKKNGDQHAPTMEMMDYWLLEKDLIHKMFEVLVPRYSGGRPAAVTKMYRLPTEYPGRGKQLALLELKDNPLPPVEPHKRPQNNSLVNVLLREAAKDYRAEKEASLTRTAATETSDYTYSNSSQANGKLPQEPIAIDAKAIVSQYEELTISDKSKSKFVDNDPGGKNVL